MYCLVEEVGESFSILLLGTLVEGVQKICR